MRQIRWKNSLKNYLKHDEPVRLLMQESFYHDLKALQEERSVLSLSYLDMDDMLYDILHAAEEDENYNLCQLVIDVAKRYRIRLNTNG